MPAWGFDSPTLRRSRVDQSRSRKLGGNRGAVVSTEARAAGRAAQTARSEARAADLEPVIRELRTAGITSLGATARALTERGIPTSRGGGAWTPMQVSRVLERLAMS